MASGGGSQSKLPGDSKSSGKTSGKQQQTPVVGLEKESLSQSDESKAKRGKCAIVIPKKKHQDLVKSLISTELNTLQSEMRAAVEEQFEDSNFREFIDELFKEDKLMNEIAREHHDSFAAL